MAMEESVVCLNLLLPGRFSSLNEWNLALEQSGIAIVRNDEGEFVLQGGAMGGTLVDLVLDDFDGEEAFRLVPLPDEIREAVSASPTAVVLSFMPPLILARRGIAATVQAFADAGVLAVRVEESKAGGAIESWIAAVAEGDDIDLTNAIVIHVQTMGGPPGLRTLGMHAFSLPDVKVTLDDAFTLDVASLWLRSLCTYQITEAPLLLSGHWFSIGALPRRQLDRWPDDWYPPGHLCNNPFGVWRVAPEGGAVELSQANAVVFKPVLRAVFAATEAELGRPLEREEFMPVLELCQCIVMPHPKALELERKRGYADINPRRAYEEWQIAGGHRAGLF